MTKLITIIGATGAQGGSVARMFLTDPKLKGEWKVRGVTRDVTKDKSKNLEALGAEMVQANVEDMASLEKAFEGSHAVFAVTNYWETIDKDKEVQQGKNMADAAKKQNVKQYVWSTLLNVNELSGGKLPNVYHFDGKAEVEAYIRKIGLDASFFLPGFYMSNLKGMHLMRLAEDGTWTLGLATVPSDARIPFFDTRDTGKYVKGMILHWEEAKGRHVLGASEYVTPLEVVAMFKEVFPKAGATAKYVTVPEEVFRAILGGMKYPEFAVTELVENFRLLGEFGYYGGEELTWTHGIMKDKPISMREFVKGEWSELE